MNKMVRIGIIALAVLLGQVRAQEVGQEISQVVDAVAAEVDFPLVTSINGKVAGLLKSPAADIVELILDIFALLCVDCLGCL
jgi:hypothetical protein